MLTLLLKCGLPLQEAPSKQEGEAALELLSHPTPLETLTSTHGPKTSASAGTLVRLDPPPMDTDYFFNLDECEGIADLYADFDDLPAHHTDLQQTTQ